MDKFIVALVPDERAAFTFLSSLQSLDANGGSAVGALLFAKREKAALKQLFS